MSEYQYYEFLAIDRPLTEEQHAELRALSTRAEITATRFTNEYEWGDFKGDPGTMMERHFDAHLYFANWGTRRLMFRVPRGAMDTETAKQYVCSDVASLTETDEHLIIDLNADREPDDYGDDDYVDWDETTPDLGSMVDARSELMSGDLRLLYLAWLLAVQWDEIDDEDTEPPVPAGLGDLSASLQTVAHFLQIDEDLIDAAAEASADLYEEDPGEISEWIASLPTQDKDNLLARVALGEGGHVQALLLRRFRESTSGQSPTAAVPARTVREMTVAAAANKAEIVMEAVERLRAKDAERAAEKAADWG